MCVVAADVSAQIYLMKTIEDLGSPAAAAALITGTSAAEARTRPLHAPGDVARAFYWGVCLVRQEGNRERCERATFHRAVLARPPNVCVAQVPAAEDGRPATLQRRAVGEAGARGGRRVLENGSMGCRGACGGALARGMWRPCITPGPRPHGAGAGALS